MTHDVQACVLRPETTAAMQVGVDYYKQFNFIRYWSTKHSTQPLSHMESVMCSAATMAILYNEDTTPFMRKKRLRNAACIVCLSDTGHPARLITKYRPPSMVFVASTNLQTVRQVCVPHLCSAVVKFPAAQDLQSCYRFHSYLCSCRRTHRLVWLVSG